MFTYAEGHNDIIRLGGHFPYKLQQFIKIMSNTARQMASEEWVPHTGLRGSIDWYAVFLKGSGYTAILPLQVLGPSNFISVC